MAQNTLISFENLERVLLEYGKEVRNLYQLNLVHSDRIASGELLNSCEFNLEVNGSIFNVVLSMADYWKYIEYGRSPGKFPPTNKILEWIMIKPVIPRPDQNGKLPTPKQLAYLIGRKIANEGYEGSGDLQRANETLQQKFQNKIVNALSMDLGSYLQKIVIESGL
jgi:hypothetical protein